MLRHGGTVRYLRNLLRYKLVHHDNSKYDGYRLTYLGYDFLAIKSMVNRGTLSSVGRQIGVGKESDVFEVRASCFCKPATLAGRSVLGGKLHRDISHIVCCALLSIRITLQVAGRRAVRCRGVVLHAWNPAWSWPAAGDGRGGARDGAQAAPPRPHLLPRRQVQA